MTDKELNMLCEELGSRKGIRVVVQCDTDKEAGYLLQKLKGFNWQAMLQQSAFCDYEVVVVGRS